MQAGGLPPGPPAAGNSGALTQLKFVGGKRNAKVYLGLPGHGTDRQDFGPPLLVQTHSPIPGFTEHVNRIDKAHLTRRVRQRQSVSSASITEEADAVKQRAICDTACGENDLFAGSEVPGGVYTLGIADSH